MEEPEPPEAAEVVSVDPERVDGILGELKHESEDPSMEDLWDLADETETEPKPTPKAKATKPAEVPPPSPPPEEEPEPEDSKPAEKKDPIHRIAEITDPEDPVSWLRMAGELAAAGRKEEAEMCRKTAMSLLEENR